jgi:flagellar hook-associated protein 1
MSLISALNVGQTALAVSQAALQVTGNNIANSGNPDYTREVAGQSETTDQELSPGVYIGTGVDLSSVQRQVDNALNGRLNSSISDNDAANVATTWTGQIQTIFNALGTTNLNTSIASFTSAWSTLANNPQDSAQQQVVVQAGAALGQQANSMATQLGTVQTDIGAQLTSLASDANQYAQQIAGLNEQISESQTDNSAAPGGDNSLLDQRDAVIQQLAGLVNIQTVNQGSGMVNVYIGSEPLVMGTDNRGLTVTQSGVNGQPTYSLNFAADNGNVTATSGQLGALLTAQTQATTILQQLNTLTGGIITAVNNIHASGQASEGFTSVTGTNQVLDPTAALNSSAAGLAFPPQNGSFVVHVTDTTTGLTTSTLVPVSLTGSSGDTTLNGLVASLNGITGVQASIQGGMLQIQAANPNSQISFSQDSSNTLAALGINTFFNGSNALNIGVNSTLTNNPGLLATGTTGNPGDNTNALALAQFDTTSQAVLGGTSVDTAYTNLINNITSAASAATNNASATLDIRNTLQAQQQALSGVSLNEEAINLIKQQQAFQGAARLVSTIDQMMTTLFDIT